MLFGCDHGGSRHPADTPERVIDEQGAIGRQPGGPDRAGQGRCIARGRWRVRRNRRSPGQRRLSSHPRLWRLRDQEPPRPHRAQPPDRRDGRSPALSANMPETPAVHLEGCLSPANRTGGAREAPAVETARLRYNDGYFPLTPSATTRIQARQRTHAPPAPTPPASRQNRQKRDKLIKGFGTALYRTKGAPCGAFVFG